LCSDVVSCRIKKLKIAISVVICRRLLIWQVISEIRLKAKRIRDFLFRRGKDIDYSIGHYSIKLPYGHNLPGFQRNHPHYDRFLPHLAKYLPGGSFVVDVGANCGDTFAGMFNENPSLNFVCVEADAFFSII